MINTGGLKKKEGIEVYTPVMLEERYT